MAQHSFKRFNCYLVLLHDLLGKSISKNMQDNGCHYGILLSVKRTWEKCSTLPEVHNMVLVISSVQVHMVRIQEHECKQYNEDFHRLFPSVDKVAVENIGIFS